MQVTCQHHAPVALRPRKNSGTHWTGGSRATTVEQCGLSRLYFSVLETHNNDSRYATLRNNCGFGSWPRDPTEPYRKATTTAGPHHPVTKCYSDSLPRKLHDKITGYGGPKTVWLICGTNWIKKTHNRHNIYFKTYRIKCKIPHVYYYFKNNNKRGVCTNEKEKCRRITRNAMYLHIGKLQLEGDYGLQIELYHHSRISTVKTEQGWRRH